MAFDIKQYVEYYTACYLADNKAIGLTDVFGSNYEKAQFFSNPDLILDTNNDYPITFENGKSWQKQIFLYGLDKQLLGSFCGVKSSSTQYTPIFLFPVQMFVDGNQAFTLEADLDNRYLNPAFVAILRKHKVADELDELIENLDAIDGFSKEAIQYLHQLLSFFDKEGSSPLDLFPELLLEEEIHAAKTHQLIPHFAVGLVKRSFQTRSLVRELNHLLEKESFSRPMESLFDPVQSINLYRKKLDTFSPFSLSQAQKEIIEACLSNPISLIQGPPGTGKSFCMVAMAINAALAGKSVLITSRTDQAIDVLYEGIESFFQCSEFVFRVGSGPYKTNFKKQLDKLRLLKKKDYHGLKGTMNSLKNQIKKTRSSISSLERKIESSLENEFDFSDYLIHGQNNLFHKWKMEYQLVKQKNSASITTLSKEMISLTKKLKEDEIAYVKAYFEFTIRYYVGQHMMQVQNFKSSIYARNKKTRKTYLKDVNLDRMFKFLNIWMVNSRQVGQIFPLEKEMFDLVIVDEATQVDIASILPILYRGKHVVFSGDSNQLRHLSFLSKKWEENLQLEIFKKQSNEIAKFRSDSILDLANKSLKGTSNIFYLQEHFRSDPRIIHFSNQTYYGSKIRAMNGFLHRGKDPVVTIDFVEGERKSNGCNYFEAKWIIKHIKQNHLENPDITVGIISPYRKQVDMLRRLAAKNFSSKEIQKMNIKIDTPYGFQGDEKDIMYLSLVIDKNTSSRVYQYLNRPGVLNVAITRARQKQFVLCSTDINLLPESHILRKYLEFNHNQLPFRNSEYLDSFSIEVIAFLETCGVKEILKNFEFTDLVFDLAFRFREKDFVIDLVGFPGDQEDYLEVYYHKMLARMQANLIVIPYSAWFVDQSRIKDEIKQIIFNVH